MASWEPDRPVPLSFRVAVRHFAVTFTVGVLLTVLLFLLAGLRG